LEVRAAHNRTSHRPADAELLELVFDQAPSFMAVTTGSDHVFTKINRNYFRLIGKTENVVGRKFLEVIPESREQGIFPFLESVYRSGQSYFASGVTVNLPAEQGSSPQHYVDFSLQPLFDHAGKVQGILIQGFDVTEKALIRQELENERENFRNLFRQTPEIVVVTSGPSHVFEFVNAAHVRALGFDATGLSVRESQPESVGVHRILDEVFRTGKTAELKEIQVTVTGRLRYFNFTYTARRSTKGELNGVMILGVEISDHKETERKLEKAVHVRDEFISVASHELKTPVTALKLQTDLTTRKIRRGVIGTLERDNMLRLLDGTNRQLDQLTRLIEDMLDVARLATGRLKLELKPSNLASVSRDAFDAFAPQFLLAHVPATFSVISEPSVNVDVFRVEQVLTNLLSNSLKYGNGEPVHVEVGEQGGEAFVRVTDQGIGMEPGVQAAVFERFARAMCDRSVSGLGLGLYIGRQIAQSHGGRIEVESELGIGSKFSVVLPLLI
jgi:PAS domain S-box-containing protein